MSIISMVLLSAVVWVAACLFTWTLCKVAAKPVPTPCVKCGHDDSVTVCPQCGKDKGSNNYCLQCGYIYYKAGGY